MARSTDHGRHATAGGAAAEPIGTAEEIGRIEAAVNTARTSAPTPDSVQFIAALALLRQLREQLAVWEPELIDAARANGASWAQLAPALGVASRQAAERRALRLRPSTDQAATTGDQRVSAERDRRAQTRAVDTFARSHGADLRVLAAQIGALGGLPRAAGAPIAALHAALGGADAAALLQPLLEARTHLGPDNNGLAAQIDELAGRAETARADARARRRR